MLVTDLGIVIEVKPVLIKVPISRVVILLGIFILDNFLHSKKANGPIVLTEFGIVISDRLMHA